MLKSQIRETKRQFRVWHTSTKGELMQTCCFETDAITAISRVKRAFPSHKIISHAEERDEKESSRARGRAKAVEEEMMKGA